MKVTLSKDRDQYVSGSTQYTIYGENGKIGGYVVKDGWGVFYVPQVVSQFDASLSVDELEGLAKAMKEIA